MANTSPRHMPVLGNVHPIKIEKFDFFFVTLFFCSLNFVYFLIDRDTQEVPMKNTWKKLSVQFLRYTPLHC